MLIFDKNYAMGIVLGKGIFSMGNGDEGNEEWKMGDGESGNGKWEVHTIQDLYHT